jgi:GNAT superfamily N-acetyltransferase
VNGCNANFDVRLVRRTDADYSAALHLALGTRPPGRANQFDATVADLLADSRERGLSLDLLFGVFRGPACVSAALAVEIPGRAALVFAPETVDGYGVREATTACLSALQHAAWERSIILLEMLLSPDSHVLTQAVTASGLRYLTQLLYLRRPLDAAIPSGERPKDLQWVSYTENQADLFAQALVRSYAQSLDCPELTGLRQMSDVLAGHRAAGPFDPALWSVAVREAQPVAVLLLSRLARQEVVEIVYMGLAQVARGTGVAEAVMRRAVDAVGRVGANTLALAVDHRNTPARKLYARWGFTQFATRDAWIVTSPPTEG